MNHVSAARVLAFTALVLAGTWAPFAANAVPLTSPLVSQLNGTCSGNACTPLEGSPTSFGTLTFSNVANGDVRIDFDLTGDFLAHHIFLNTNLADETVLNVTADFTTHASVTVDLNGEGQAGCNSCFDIAISGANGNGNGNSTIHENSGFFVLAAANGDPLTIDNFVLVNEEGVDAAVHIGNFGDPRFPNADSILAAEFPGARNVPEPASLILLGTGLAGLATWARTRRR